MDPKFKDLKKWLAELESMGEPAIRMRTSPHQRSLEELAKRNQPRVSFQKIDYPDLARSLNESTPSTIINICNFHHVVVNY